MHHVNSFATGLTTSYLCTYAPSNMGNDLSCYWAHQSTERKLQRPLLRDETKVQEQLWLWGTLPLSHWVPVQNIKSFPTFLYPTKHRSIHSDPCIHPHSTPTHLQTLGREDFAGKRLQKTVTGPTEHLLTNHPRGPVCYVTKEESVWDFSKAVFSNLWNASLGHDAINCQESAEAGRIRKL